MAAFTNLDANTVRMLEALYKKLGYIVRIMPVRKGSETFQLFLMKRT